MATDYPRSTANSRPCHHAGSLLLSRFLEYDHSIRRGGWRNPTVDALRGGGPTLDEFMEERDTPLEDLFFLDKKYAAGECEDHGSPTPSDDPVDEDEEQVEWKPKTSGPYANLPDAETEVAWRLGDLYIAREEGGRRCLTA
jgi:hypothetical protein